jgi:arginine:pyruvate transaminase
MYYSSLTERIAGDGADGFAVSDRAQRMIEAGEDVIALTLGDPDFETPADIAQAAICAIQAGRTHYTPISGQDNLRSAIASDQSRRDGIRWHPHNVVVFPGAQSALFCAMMCAADRGRRVLVFDPMYATYAAVVGASGAELVPFPVELPFGTTRRPSIDIDRLVEVLDHSFCAVLLNLPNNPGGFILPPEDLARLADLCCKWNLWLISDEVYRDLIFDGHHVPPSALPEMATRTIVVSSLSKSHAMTGWRIGWAVAPVEMATHLGRLAQCSLFGSPPFIQDAAVQAIKNGAAISAPFLSAFRDRRDILAARLDTSTSLTYLHPDSGMFSLVDVSRTGIDSTLFANRALSEGGVAVVPGTAFSARGRNFVRVSFAQSTRAVDEGALRLVKFADSLARDGVRMCTPRI